jgi:hypothetical protein
LRRKVRLLFSVRVSWGRVEEIERESGSLW